MKVVLADDHNIFRQSLCLLLENRSACEVVADASSFDGLREAVTQHLPDCILVDYHMPGGKALHVVESLKLKCPSLKIVVLTGSQAGALLKRISLSCVDALIHKSDDADTILSVLDSVSSRDSSGPCICSDLVAKLIEGVDLDFTHKELAVLEYLVEGVAPSKIAELMCISSRTVEKHKQNMMAKAELSNVVELIELGHRLLYVE